MKYAVRYAVLYLGIIIALYGCTMNRAGLAGDNGSAGQNTESSESVYIAVEPIIQIDNEDSSAEEASAAEITEEEASLVFAGDILLSGHVLNAYQQAGGIHGVLDEGYRGLIAEADSFIANQEFPFSNRGAAATDKEYTFRLEPEHVVLFQEMELDIVSLANNHALDFGRDALADSIVTLDQAGISYLGAGDNLDQAKAPVFREINGIRVGFLGATRVIPVADWAANQYSSGMLSTYDPTELLTAIRDLKAQCDYVVVYVHWGIERAKEPESYQRSLGRQYIEAGADLVVGSHPHVLQGIEYYQGKPIVYSLGNFVFGSSIPETALLQVDLRREDGAVAAILSLVPGTSGAGYTRTLTEESRIQAFYRQLEQISFGVTFGGEGAIRTVIQTE